MPDLWTRLRWALLCAVVLGITLPFAGGHWSPMVAVGLGLGCWVLLATGVGVHERLRVSPPGAGYGQARPSLAWWGMTLAHLGVAVFVVGVTLVRSYQTEADLRMTPGARVDVGRHGLVFEGVSSVSGPNYDAERGSFTLLRHGKPVAALHPEKRRYRSLPATPMTEAAIASGWLGDVYVSLGDAAGEGAWTVRVYHKPFVTWIWAGCALMALGGILATVDRRWRVRTTRRAAGPAPGVLG